MNSLKQPTPRTTLADVSGTRSNNFGFLRFLFATAIIFGHSFGIMGVQRDPFWNLSQGQTIKVGLAINYFFIISGFFVTASWLGQPQFWAFVRKRAVRLYPAVAVMSLFCIFVIGPLSVSNIPEYFRQLSPLAYIKALIYLHVPHLPGVFVGMQQPADVANAIHNAPPVNGPMWSIGYQMRCYLVIALFGMLGLYKRPRVILAIWSVAIAAYLAAQFGGWDPLKNTAAPVLGQLSLWPRLLTYYGLGMLAFLYRDKIPYSLPLFILSLVLLAASCVWGLALTQPICGGYAVFYFAYCKAIPLQNFTRNGDLSYGLYIYAWPIQEILAQHFHAYLNPYTLFLAAWVITIGLAILSYRFVEKPASAFFGKKKPAPRPGAESAPAISEAQPTTAGPAGS